MLGSQHDSVLAALLDEALEQGTPWLLLALVATALVLRLAPNRQDLRSRMRFVVFMLVLNVVVLPVTAIGAAFHMGVARDLRLTGSIAGAISGVGMAGLIVFGVI